MAGGSPADEHRAEERIGPEQIEGQATRTAAASQRSPPHAPLWRPAEPQRAAAPEGRPRRTPYLGAGPRFPDVLLHAYAAPPLATRPWPWCEHPRGWPRAASPQPRRRTRRACDAARSRRPGGARAAARGALPARSGARGLLSTSAPTRRSLLRSPAGGGAAQEGCARRAPCAWPASKRDPPLRYSHSPSKTALATRRSRAFSSSLYFRNRAETYFRRAPTVFELL